MLIPLIVFIVFVIVYLWWVYNDIVTSKIRVKESWSQIDVQLKRRSDLIPNLVESVKGYAKHEKSLFETVTKARAALLKAEGPKDTAMADNNLTSALKSLFAVAENYPDLKANENFLHLQKELSDTEDKVAYSRQFYNTAVMDYNKKLLVFPNMIFANIFGFKSEEFFKAEEEDKKEVKVSFDKE